MYWKARFSRCIDQKNDVYIFQNWRYRWLAFESMTIQTLIHRQSPERIELNYIEALTLPARFQPGTICLLGLGGAGVMHALSPFYRNISCIAVEQSSTVVEMAQKHFFLEKLPFLHIEQHEAYAYLETNSVKFAHLLVDLFNASTFPEHCNSIDFVIRCQNNLHSEGVLAVNFANISSQMSLFYALKECFAHQIIFISLPRTTNVVALCFQEKNLNPFLDKLKHYKNLRSLSWQPGWGHVACF